MRLDLKRFSIGEKGATDSAERGEKEQPSAGLVTTSPSLDETGLADARKRGCT